MREDGSSPAARYLYPAGDSWQFPAESRRTGIPLLASAAPAPENPLRHFTVGNTVP